VGAGAVPPPSPIFSIFNFVGRETLLTVKIATSVKQSEKFPGSTIFRPVDPDGDTSERPRNIIAITKGVTVEQIQLGRIENFRFVQHVRF
jgi:hypothetical protein